MGLILILIAAVAIFGFLIWFFDKQCFEGLSIISTFICVMTTAALVILSIIGISNSLTKEADFVVMQERYNFLEYQLENSIYDNDNDIGLKELYNDILDYNQEVIGGRINGDKFMLNIFYPLDYDELQLIELPQGEI